MKSQEYTFKPHMRLYDQKYKRTTVFDVENNRIGIEVPAKQDSGSGGLSGGAKAAIAIVAIVVVGGGIGFCLWRRKRKLSENYQQFQDYE